MKKMITVIALSILVSPLALAGEEIQLAAAIGSSSTRLETGASNTDVATSQKENGKAGTAKKEATDSSSIDTVVYGVLVGVGLLAAAR